MFHHPFRLVEPVARNSRPTNELRKQESAKLTEQCEVGPDTRARGTRLDVPGPRLCAPELVTKAG